MTAEPAPAIEWQTIPKYLIGDAEAIRAVAGSRQAVLLGLLFVLSAGFAREYDGESLLDEPWHLLLPLAASLATSMLLFLLIAAIAKRETDKPRPFTQSALSFLGLYWMTAPLAWLYAIPFERFLSPGDATSANLWLLGLVALWRVLLMTRVVSVLFECSMLSALPVVMLFADTVALLLLMLTPLPIVSVMGGIRLSESQQVIQMTAFLIGFFGVISCPIWLAGFGTAAYLRKMKWWTEAEPVQSRQVSVAAWCVGASSVLVWMPILPFTQPEQRLRHQVETALSNGRVKDALDVLSSHDRGDFPRHWDPPPRIGYGEKTPPVIDVLEATRERDVPVWVRETYMQKWSDELANLDSQMMFWGYVEGKEFDRHFNLLETLDPQSPFVQEQAAVFRILLEGEERTESEKERIRALLERIGPEGA